jgi:hypothetical protein
MALINCAECGHQVSSLATACPQCGCPINADASVPSPGVKEPKLPDNLWLLNKSSMFGLTPNMNFGKVAKDCQLIGSPPGSSITIDRYAEGLQISGIGDDGFARLHYSQIVAMHHLEAVKVKKEGKSVIGRALLGAVLFGPLGAVVGGVSGVGNKETAIDGYRLVYWNSEAKRYDTLLVQSTFNGLASFCRLVQSEADKYRQIHVEAMS